MRIFSHAKLRKYCVFDGLFANDSNEELLDSVFKEGRTSYGKGEKENWQYINRLGGLCNHHRTNSSLYRLHESL